MLLNGVEPAVGVVAVFDRAAGGTLTQKPGAAGCIATPSLATCADGRGLALTSSVALSPDGTSVYVALRSTDRNAGVTSDGPGSDRQLRPLPGRLSDAAGGRGGLRVRRRRVRPLQRCQDAARAVVAGDQSGRAQRIRRPHRRAGDLQSPRAPDWGAAPEGRTGPALRGLAIAPARFRALARGGTAVARGGGKVTFRLSEPSLVTFRFQRIVGGRRTGNTLRRAEQVQPPRAAVRSLPLPEGRPHVHAGPPGANAFRISGRLEGRRLARGRYRLRAVARDGAGNRSPSKTARFTIV